MTALDLAAIKARAEAATPGPWAWSGDVADADAALYAAPLAPDYLGIITASGMHTEGYIYVDPADAEFIAHARTDVPALVAEVERLRQVITDAREIGENELIRTAPSYGGIERMTDSLRGSLQPSDSSSTGGQL